MILTAYNDAEFLPRSIQALKDQTLKDIEIICVDDASTDNSLEVIQKFAKTDDRIKFIAHETNLGLSIARNDGIAIAKADFIMFCDADDYYEKSMCEKMYQAITTHDADLAISEINVIYNAHQEMKLSDDNYYALKYTGLQSITDELVLQTDLSATNKIFRRKLMDKYSLRFPEGLRYEDAFFCPAYFAISKKIFFLNERLYNYVRRANSIMSQTWSSSNIIDKAIDHTKIAIELFNFLQANNQLNQHQNLYWQLFESFLSFSLNNSKTNQKRKQTRQLAQDFITKQHESFSQATPEVQERIKRLYSAKFQPNTTRIKQILLKFMPTYKLEIENVRHIQNIHQKTQQIINDIDTAIQEHR